MSLLLAIALLHYAWHLTIHRKENALYSISGFLYECKTTNYGWCLGWCVTLLHIYDAPVTFIINMNAMWRTKDQYDFYQFQILGLCSNSYADMIVYLHSALIHDHKGKTPVFCLIS